jgi:hypothetical protein
LARRREPREPLFYTRAPLGDPASRETFSNTNPTSRLKVLACHHIRALGVNRLRPELGLRSDQDMRSILRSDVSLADAISRCPTRRTHIPNVLRSGCDLAQILCSSKKVTVLAAVLYRPFNSTWSTPKARTIKHAQILTIVMAVARYM